MKPIYLVLLPFALAAQQPAAQRSDETHGSAISTPITANVMFSNSLVNYYGGKTNLSTQWLLYEGGGGLSPSGMTHRNTNCWLYPADVSGYYNGAVEDVSIELITSKHGIAAYHTTGNIRTGSKIAMRGNDDVLYTNQVAGVTRAVSDIAVVTFSNDWPAHGEAVHGDQDQFPSLYKHERFGWGVVSFLDRPCQCCEVSVGLPHVRKRTN